MKTDRFAALLMAGVLLAAGHSSFAQTVRFGRWQVTHESRSKPLALALAVQVKEVKKRFGKNRRALPTMPGPDGKPAYPRQEVAGLIDRTREDLDQAIGQIGPELAPLSAWSAEEIRRIQEDLTGLRGQTAASFPGFALPRAIAVVASFGGFPLPGLASMNAASRQDTITSEKSNRLLDQVEEVVSRILFLAEHDDLEVTLWVGCTPAPATFRFWPQGQVKGSTPAVTIVETNGKREHVWRGLYSYQAARAEGAVTELVAYPGPAGGVPSRSEQLDLVNGSSSFCCRFNKQYCHHVTKEKDCRP